MSNTKVRAAVVIPTLNRYEHLRKCIESLRDNSQAKETELYISVDYPPAEKYVEGYEKLKDYLSEKIDGFKDVHIYFHESNLGVVKNSAFVKQEARKTHEAFIYTEDDNVFSKNFLEYINECLMATKDDDSIFAVNGYSMPIKWSHCRGIVRHNYMLSAWGYACWFSDFDKRLEFTQASIQQYLKSFRNARKLYRTNNHLFTDAVEIARGTHYLELDNDNNLQYNDISLSLMLLILDYKVYTPLVSKVRNMGHDGSGQNCSTYAQREKKSTDNYEYEQQLLDDKDTFLYKNCPIYEADDKYRKAVKNFFPEKGTTKIKEWLKWLTLSKKY